MTKRKPRRPTVGIASFEEMKARTMAIARGELRPAPDDPKVWASSIEAFEKASERDRELLARIRKTAE
jgi:predicted transcriptional regulator